MIAVAGPIVAQDDETINSELPTGTIEVKADELRLERGQDAAFLWTTSRWRTICA